MKFINKGPEPDEFFVWKNLANDDWEPSWENLGGYPKVTLLNSLLNEQGYICCYCGRRISADDCHIEHFVPRSKDMELALVYGNLHASCQKKIPPKHPRHCGSSKGEWFEVDKIISPINPDCEREFSYGVDGAVNSVTGSIAGITTIGLLQLNCDKLRNLRRNAIDGLLEGLEELSVEEKTALMTGFLEKDSRGKFEEFCFVLAQILDRYF